MTVINQGAIKVSTREGQSHADILKEMKTKVDPREAGLGVLSIRKSRNEEILLSSKRGERYRFSGRLSQAVKEKAKILALVSKRFLEIRTSMRP